MAIYRANCFCGARYRLNETAAEWILCQCGALVHVPRPADGPLEVVMTDG